MEFRVLDDVNYFLDKIPDDDAAKILAHLKSLEANQTEGLVIKTLTGKIKELVVGQYRIVFFVLGGKGFAIDVFKKQSKKTPLRIIERAEKIYHDINRFQ